MTYGRLNFAQDPNGERLWSLTDLAPHVAIAFKRLFPRVAQTAVDIQLSDTDEIRADLHWFMQRYPLEHDCEEVLTQGVQRIAARIATRSAILLPTWTPGVPAGFRDGYAPYTYQAQAAQIALGNPGLLLGDDVGLGKTISALAMLTMGAPLPAAVVVQAHLSGQWLARIETFTTLRVHVIKGTKPYDLPPADVYIYRYSNVAGWIDVIKGGLFKTSIYDEIQELRRGRDADKGRAAAVLSARAELRVGLTATPIYNYGDEIHTVMEYIRPGLLGSREEFTREWCSYSKIVKQPDALGAYLRDTGYFLRRTEHDALVDAAMPPVNVVSWEVDADQRAIDADEAITRTLALQVLSADFVAAGQAARQLDIRMRQLTGIAKARSVAAYVHLLLQDCERVLLAGWHREVYDIWRAALKEHNPVLYTGSETGVAKQRSVDAFTSGPSRVMMLSLRSGAGLDGLQEHCRDIVFGELDWSPQVHYQAIGRLRRPGQSDRVTAHYLHTNGGSDPVLLETLGLKSDQSRGIIAPGEAQAARETDDSRIKRLAENVLRQQGIALERAA